MLEKNKEASKLLMKLISSSNLGSLLSTNEIYSTLINYGVNDNEKNIDTIKLGFFDYWVEEYKNKSKVEQKYSNISISTDLNNDKSDYIKVFIPLDSAHIRIGVKIILDYLNSKNIKYTSCIDNRIHNSDFYVLLKNNKDVEELSSFIKYNYYIQAGLLKPNPFLYSEKHISYSNNTGLDENYILAKFINLYLQKRYPKDSKDELELDFFLRFCTDYYNEVLTGLSSTKRFLYDMNEEDNYINSNKIKKYKDIMEIVLKSFQLGFTFNDFMNINQKKNLSQSGKYNLSDQEKKKIIDLAILKNFENDIYKRVSEGDRNNVKDIEIAALYNIIKNGNFNVITDENYRDLLTKTVTQEDVNRIVQLCSGEYVAIPVDQLTDIEIENYSRYYIESIYDNNKRL